MLSAFLKGLTILKERPFWRVVWQSLCITAAAFAALYGVVWVVLSRMAVAEIWWIDIPVEVLGGLAVLVLTWFLFPAVATFVLSLFIDRIVTAVERQYYPLLPAPTAPSWWQTIAVALKFTAILVVLNLIMLPLYLVPVVNVVGFYAINAYLLGREYFELVVLRHLAPVKARQLWRAHRLQLFVAGLLIAGLLTVPLLNLAAPLLAAAFMVHFTTPLWRDA
jgi:CysZ protein